MKKTASKIIVLPVPTAKQTTKSKVVGLAFAQENAYNQQETAQTNPNQPKTVVQKSNLPFKPVSQTLNENKQPAKLLKISNPHLKQFLGNVEIKEKQSLAITLDSGEGGGKTHTAFQFAGETANNGYKTIVWSLEEHAESNLSKQKQQKYFSDYAKQNVSVVSEDSELTAEENYKRIVDSVKYYDVIVIDSWAKVLELKGTANFDQEFRKAFDGKIFLIIFQRTADGKMRGGAKGGFDADIVLKVEVDRADFRNNYVYNHKNRYNEYMPISDLKYSPYYQKLMPKQTATNQIVLQAPQMY